MFCQRIKDAHSGHGHGPLQRCFRTLSQQDGESSYFYRKTGAKSTDPNNLKNQLAMDLHGSTPINHLVT